MKKPKITQKDLEVIDTTVTQIKECPFCNDQKVEIKKCAESHNVKDNLKSVTWHLLRCSDCRGRVQFITECKKRGHK